MNQRDPPTLSSSSKQSTRATLIQNRIRRRRAAARLTNERITSETVKKPDPEPDLDCIPRYSSSTKQQYVSTSPQQSPPHKSSSNYTSSHLSQSYTTTPSPSNKSSSTYHASNIECTLDESPVRGSPFYSSDGAPDCGAEDGATADSSGIDGYAGAGRQNVKQNVSQFVTCQRNLNSYNNGRWSHHSISPKTKLWNPTSPQSDGSGYSSGIVDTSPTLNLRSHIHWDSDAMNDTLDCGKESSLNYYFSGLNDETFDMSLNTNTSYNQRNKACTTRQKDIFITPQKTYHGATATSEGKRSPAEWGLTEWADGNQSTGLEITEVVPWSGGYSSDVVVDADADDRGVAACEVAGDDDKSDAKVAVGISQGNNNKDLNNSKACKKDPPTTSNQETESKILAPTKIIDKRKWTKAKHAIATAKGVPKMENPMHTVSPKEAEEDFIRKRVQSMLEWSEGTSVKLMKSGEVDQKKERIITPKHNVSSTKQPRKSLEQTLQQHAIVSITQTTSSVFSEDDSIYDNPYLLAMKEKSRQIQERRTGAVNGDMSHCKAISNPISPGLSAIDSESVNELHVSVDSRDIGRYCPPNVVSPDKEASSPSTAAVVTPKVSPRVSTNLSPGEESDGGSSMHTDREAQVTSISTKSQYSSNIPIVSPVQPNEESQHLLHVSMGSRDLGKAPLHRKVDTRSSYKSYSAPSFDEAASVRSRLSNGESSAREEQVVVGNKLLWGGKFLGRERLVKENGQNLADGHANHFVSINSPACTTLDMSKEADNVLKKGQIYSSFLSQEADHVLHNKEAISPTGQCSVDISKEADCILSLEEASVSMTQLMKSATQKATWSRQPIQSSIKNAKTSQMLPPIHPDSKEDKKYNAQGRTQQPKRSKNIAAPSITEYSPTMSDHSADAAAGKLKNLIFGPLDPPEIEEDGSQLMNATKLDPIPMQRVSKSFPAVREKTDHESCMSIDSWEVDIFGSKASSVVMSEHGCSNDIDPKDAHTVHDASSSLVSPNTLKLSKQLEMKLEMLRKSSGASDAHGSHGDNKSTVSSKISVASIQPSVESACVRQNVDIALMMENTMMDFMVTDEEEEVSVYSDFAVDDPPLQLVPSEDSDLLSNPPTHKNVPPAIIPAPAPKPVLHNTASRHQYFSKKHFPSLLSVDEEEEFSGPNFNASPRSPTDSSPKSISTKSSSVGNGPHVRSKQRELGKFLDRFRDNLMTGCAPLKDEDLASSLVENTSQFNSSSFLVNGDDDEMNDYSDDATSLRTNTTKSKCQVSDLKPANAQKMLHDDDVIRSYNSDVLKSYQKQAGAEKEKEREQEESVVLPDVDETDDDVAVNSSHQTEWVKMSERERHKGRSLNWHTNNGVNEDEQYSPPKFVASRSRARISPRVLTSRMSLSYLSSYQASIRKHFREAKDAGNEFYSSDNHEQKLSYINECSKEDEDSSDEDADGNDETPEYEYDDFLREFSTIAEDAEKVLFSNEQRHDESLESFLEENEQHSYGNQHQNHVTNLLSELQSKESYSTLYEIPSLMPGNQKKYPVKLSLSKSNVSSPESLLDQSHPHSVPYSTSEVPRSKLEEKLRGLSATAKDCNSSVATSELGSLMSESNRSQQVPQMIFHRTHPLNRLPDSARSSPSSMGNTYNASELNGSLKFKALTPQSPRSNLKPLPEPAVNLNEDVVRSQQLRREHSAATAAATIAQPQHTADQNEDVVKSQRLLQENVGSATSSLTEIGSQLSKLRSIRSTQTMNRNGSEHAQETLADNRSNTNNDEQVTIPTSDFKDPKYTVQSMDHSSTAYGYVSNDGQSTINGVESLRLRYEQFISTASSAVGDLSRQTSYRPGNTIDQNKSSSSEATTISKFWKQLDFSSEVFVDQPRPCVNTSQNSKNKSRDPAPRKLTDDASQQSTDIYEIAPRGNGYGVLNKNRWIIDDGSGYDHPRSSAKIHHHVYESSSQHAFEVSPSVIPGGHNSVVAKLPIKSKVNRAQNTADRPKYLGSRIASSPFLKMTSSTASIRGTNPTKSVISRSNVFSSRKKIISIEKLNNSNERNRKKDTSWINKGKTDNSWITSPGQ